MGGIQMVARAKGARAVGMVIGMALGIFLIPVLVTVCEADNAEVLPKGVMNANLEGKFYFPVKERFDPNGDPEPLAADLNGLLDGSVFPDLRLLEAALGLPPGTANIGRSVVTFEQDFIITEFLFAYGITDRLTAGIKIPYWDVRNHVNARLDTTNATVGANPSFGQPGDPFRTPLIPIALGGVPLTTRQAQDLLGAGFGFKPITSWSDNGIADIETGLKYQYFKNDNWRLAVTGIVHWPTGQVDDPDSLVDYGFGSGAYALFFYFHNDYTGIKNLLLDATFKYKLFIPDDETLRVPSNVNEPITPFKDKVTRDIGDVFEFEGAAGYNLGWGFSIGGLYRYAFSLEDRVTGDNPLLNYRSLEEETRIQEHVAQVGLSYTTLPLYLEKRFPLPLEMTVTYRNRFAGSDNVLKSEYISVALGVYF